MFALSSFLRLIGILSLIHSALEGGVGGYRSTKGCGF